MMETVGNGPSPIVIASGPLDAERRVVAWVLENRAREAGALWPPVRVVVPSRSLARHLVAVLVRELGALAGVVVQTHRAVAREVLERAGETPPPGGSAVQGVLVRQLADEQAALREALGGLEDGYAAVAATVRDLVDAGLDGGNGETVSEAVEACTMGAQRRRCLAVVDVARRWVKHMAHDGLPDRSDLLVRATELLHRGGGDPLPSRAILIHGFAEATGLVSGLLEALVHRHGAVALLDLPPDPARPRQRDAGWRFAERLADRLAGAGWLAGAAGATLPGESVELEAFQAPGPDAELREVAARIRGLLDAGVRPETIGVVARSIDPITAAAVRRHLGRLGVPLSGEGVTVAGGELQRRLGAVLELLSARGRTRVAAWLGAADTVPGVSDRRLLELGLRSAGVERLADVGNLDPGRICRRGVLPLPVITETGEEDDAGSPARLELPLAELEAARRAAVALLDPLERRPETARPHEVLAWVRHVLDRLGLAGEAPVASVVEGLDRDLACLPTISWKHLEPLFQRQLAAAEPEPLGGDGGGVQVLTVMEARSRTFEHLFLIGLNRGVFPRRIHEDPLLPDGVRRALTAVLPEVPLAERSRLEERHLFAQLLAAAPHVTFSWLTVDADGRALNPSAFVERLLLEGRLHQDALPVVADVFSPPAGRRGLRPALEHAVAAGLEGDRRGLVAAAGVLEDRRAAHLGPLLDELDPPRPRSGPGPFLGLTGQGPPEPLWATRLEAYSSCPWRQFLEYELGLAEPPESLLATTALGGLLAGRVVHRVLERIVREAGAPTGRGARLEKLRDAEPRRVHWPEDRILQAMVAAAAAETAVRAGVPALAAPLARAARPYLERARDVDWQNGERPDTLGAEIDGACELDVEGLGTVTVCFRADRVDRRKDGTLVLTDYKTGKLPSPRAALALRRGLRLQAAIYARGGGQNALGRYLYLKPDSGGEDILHYEQADELHRVVSILFGAWNEGIAVPRWDGNHDERHGKCGRCPVREACFRDDSTFRLRLDRIIEGSKSVDPEDPLVLLWNLPSTPKKTREGRT